MSEASKDDAAAAKLWELSEQLTDSKRRVNELYAGDKLGLKNVSTPIVTARSTPNSEKEKRSVSKSPIRRRSVSRSSSTKKKRISPSKSR
jgi:hypothetical protein